MVNRSVSWADWDEELLSLRLLDLNSADFDLSLRGFDPGEITAARNARRRTRERCAAAAGPSCIPYRRSLVLRESAATQLVRRGATAVRQQLTM